MKMKKIEVRKKTSTRLLAVVLSIFMGVTFTFGSMFPASAATYNYYPTVHQPQNEASWNVRSFYNKIDVAIDTNESNWVDLSDLNIPDNQSNRYFIQDSVHQYFEAYLGHMGTQFSDNTYTFATRNGKLAHITWNISWGKTMYRNWTPKHVHDYMQEQIAEGFLQYSEYSFSPRRASTFEKVLNIHDFVSSSFRHVGTNTNIPTNYDEIDCINAHIGTCWDFSCVFMMLCDYYDIPCIFVTDTRYAPNGNLVGHCLNMVTLNGTTWYIVDCTRDSNISSSTGNAMFAHPTHNQFLKNFGFSYTQLPEYCNPADLRNGRPNFPHTVCSSYPGYMSTVFTRWTGGIIPNCSDCYATAYLDADLM